MVRIAIVEDEELYVRQLTAYLHQYGKEAGEEFDIAVFRDGDGITSKYEAKFDIILMDIQMKFVDGMTAAKEIRGIDSKVIIIFITNMTQYAIRGYEVDALDYVLKPVDYFAFSQRIAKAVGRLRRRDRKFMMVNVRGGVIRLDVEDIYYIESKGHNLIFHTASGEYSSYGTMKQVQEELENAGFSRGNKCYLINLKHVEGIQDKCAVIKGEHLQLSRPRMNYFMQDLTKYWGEA